VAARIRLLKRAAREGISRRSESPR